MICLTGSFFTHTESTPEHRLSSSSFRLRDVKTDAAHGGGESKLRFGGSEKRTTVELEGDSASVLVGSFQAALDGI